VTCQPVSSRLPAMVLAAGKGCIRLIKQAKGFYGRVGLGLPRTVRGQR
jgi:hypothetical protein